MPISELRIYGDAVKFRTKLLQRVTLGKHLLDELAGARQSIEDSAPQNRADRPPGHVHAVISAIAAEMDAARVLDPIDTRAISWGRANRTLVEIHLGPAAKGMFGSIRLDARRDSPSARVDQLETYLQTDLATLGHLILAIPAKKQREAVAARSVRLDELWTSALLDPQLMLSYEQRLSTIGTPRSAVVAIGAAKELVEATLKAALQRLHQPAPPPSEDFQRIAKRVRDALRQQFPQAAPDADGVEHFELFQTHLAGLLGDLHDWAKDDAASDEILAIVDQVRAIQRRARAQDPNAGSSIDTFSRFQSHLSGVLQDLNKWRDLYGTGHGRTRIPPGLASRHGRLAVDVAETYVRLLVTTLEDLGLLENPPEQSPAPPRRSGSSIEPAAD
jgi:hypothetical protein